MKMKPKSETTKEIVSIIEEPGALTFVTRKEWHELPDMLLGEITQHETALVFMGNSSIFLLLRNMNPSLHIRVSQPYKLVKISIDEDGKQKFSMMLLSDAEADQLRRNQLTLWE